jgi:hypothetical protein
MRYLWLVLLCGWSSLAQSVTWDQLQQDWAARPAQQAFVELRYDSLLDMQMEYHGRYRTLGEQAFKAEYVAPQPLTITRLAERLTLQYPDKTQQISLAKLAELRAFFDVFEAMLAGDFSRLQADYQGVLKQEGQGWQADWQLHAWLSDKPKRLRLSGDWQAGKAVVNQIRIDLQNGDWRQFNLVSVD